MRRSRLCPVTPASHDCRTHRAQAIHYNDKATDRKWEEGDDISVLEFAATEYGRSARVIASTEVKAKILEIGINKCVLVRAGLIAKISFEN